MSCSFLTRCSRTILVIALSAFILGITMPDSPRGEDLSVSGNTRSSQDEVDPIVIEGNSNLSSHSSVRSGTGSKLHPYVISDYLINCSASGRGGIAIRNTTAHLILRNITVIASDLAPGIYIRAYRNTQTYQYEPLNILMENVTIIGGDRQIYIYYPYMISIKNSTFVSDEAPGQTIYTLHGMYMDIKNNTFDSPGLDIYLYRTQRVRFIENSGEIDNFYQTLFRNSLFANNTFLMTGMGLYSGWQSDMEWNHLTSSSSSTDLVRIEDCNRLMIQNNTIQGGDDAFMVLHPNTNSPVHDRYYSTSKIEFEYNHINGSRQGIRFYWATGHPTITYCLVHHNWITNCTDMGITVVGGGHHTTKIFYNRFLYNHGSGDTYFPSLAQAEDRYDQFSWSDRGIGNFWQDKRGPDDNSDGFVDDTDYDLFSIRNAKDEYPVSNRYFDFRKPHIEFLRPSGRYVDNSYINISWDASDDLSGIRRIDIRYGFTSWIDVTNRSEHAFHLPGGQYRLKLRAIDNGDLENEIEKEIIVNETNMPFTFISPEEGSYLNSSDVVVSWDFQSDFVPRNLSISVDEGDPLDWPTETEFETSLEDGEHVVDLLFTDHYGNQIQDGIEFVVDTTPPAVSILYPVEGSVIFNDIVHFVWEATDSHGLKPFLIRIDDEPEVSKSGTSYSSSVSREAHDFSVIAEDLAGNVNQDIIGFSVRDNTSLNINAPILEGPTSTLQHLVQWEYLADVEISSIELTVDESIPVQVPPDQTSYEVTFTEDGNHQIKVSAKDPAGNIISDSIRILIDRKPPTVGITDPLDGSYLNRTNIFLEWGAIDDFGIDHYDLFMDGDLLAGGVNQNSRSVVLSPGEHSVQVVAYDTAGNMNDHEIDFVIDIRPPELNITSPVQNLITEPYVDLEWKSDDDWGIEHFNITIDQGETEELGLSSSRQLQLNEGKHVIRLHAVDLAGNLKTVIKELTVELNPPEVSFKNAPNGPIAFFNGLIEWDAYDSMGVERVKLTVDGVEYQVSLDVAYFNIELQEGFHELEILVEDAAGRQATDEASFTIDMTPPSISKKDTPIELDGTTAIIYWDPPQEQGLEKVLLLDGQEQKREFSLSDGSFIFTEMDPGNYTARLKVTDAAGNEAVLEWVFDIEDPSEQGSGGTSSSGAIIAIALVIIVIAAVAVLLFLFVFRRSDEKEDEEPPKVKAPSMRPDKLKIGPVPRQNSRPPAPTPAKRSAAPTDKEHSYIRPKKEKAKREVRAPPAEKPVDKKERNDTLDLHMPSSKTEGKRDPGKPMFTSPEDNIETWDDTSEIEQWDEIEEF